LHGAAGEVHNPAEPHEADAIPGNGEDTYSREIMKIALTTPTGNIGRRIAESLVGGEHKITLLCRNPEKVADFAEKGAIVREGSLDDAGFVREATKGAEMLFWLTPVEYGTRDLRSAQNAFGDVAAGAIQANRITRVVNLSSVGAQCADGVGPINGIHDIEKRLNQTGAYVTHLRPAYFFENFLEQLEPIRSAGSVFLPIPASTTLPMIATKDISQVAIECLTDNSWTGRPVRELLGPEDLSFDEAARRISTGIGKEVKFAQIDEAAYAEPLRQMGVGESIISALAEMHAGVASGLVRPEAPRSKESTTPTRLEDFASQVMKPLLEQNVAT
jgi:uncharacterized protein YbjT (DUF2867 family)